MTATISAIRRCQGAPVQGPDASVRSKPSQGPDASAPPRPRQAFTRPSHAPIHGPSALTLTDAGEPVVPETPADWLDWVAATKTRNHAIGDSLRDWLDLYGTAKGFKR